MSLDSRAMKILTASLCSVLLCNSLLAQPERRRPRTIPADTEYTKLFTLRSKLLSDFWGREQRIEAGVVLPPGWTPQQKLPVAYDIHGFGGSHRVAWRSERRLHDHIEEGEVPAMIWVFLNAQFSLGHHEFADSVNNGPWGQALTEEFIPALETAFGAFGAPAGRFLTGHSSGGWSSLWLQVTYPDFFNGTWSTAPDSVDFRDFTGVDIYRFENAFQDPEGNEIMLMRQNGKFVRSIREYVEGEVSRREYGGQFASFDAVFSPRGEDGRPMRMIDRETGRIDRAVAAAWRKYDIGLILRENWETLGPRLKGKLHVWCGTEDTFRLEGACRLLQTDLRLLESDAEVLLVEGRHHGSLMRPHEEYWPQGMLVRIYQDMGRRFEAASRN